MMTATLALEDGTVLIGDGFGAQADAVFELVFNTSMAGYQEILSDPSYRGQGVLFTSSHIGNVGINPEDNEAEKPQASAVVVHSLSRMVSNWRASLSLSDWLAMHSVPGVEGIDTRYLTRKLRDQGVMKAALSTSGTLPDRLVEMARKWQGLDGRDMVREVTCQKAARWDGDGLGAWIPSHLGRETHVVVYDFGVKQNILRHLASWGARLTVVPAYTSAGEVLRLHPDGIFLSNGPGDPDGLPGIVTEVGYLLDCGVPLFGICLGHQLIGKALGGAICKLKFGHHSGNHPVRDTRTGRVWITAQNHNYAVLSESLDPAVVELTHLSLNDGTLEGLRLRNRPVFSIQFHPEAAPGPHDAHGLFGQFFSMMG